MSQKILPLKAEDIAEFTTRTHVLSALTGQRQRVQEEINHVATTISLLVQSSSGASPDAQRFIDTLVNGHQLDGQKLSEKAVRLHHTFDVLSADFSKILGERYQLGNGETWNLDLDKKMLVREPSTQKQEGDAHAD